jgi:hypothetical protein
MEEFEVAAGVQQPVTNRRPTSADLPHASVIATTYKPAAGRWLSPRSLSLNGANLSVAFTGSKL